MGRPFNVPDERMFMTSMENEIILIKILHYVSTVFRPAALIVLNFRLHDPSTERK